MVHGSIQYRKSKQKSINRVPNNPNKIVNEIKSAGPFIAIIKKYGHNIGLETGNGAEMKEICIKAANNKLI